MLQAQPLTTGREIAQRLGIDARTVRRYIAALQALDIPVEGQRGVGGGYRIRPGYRLPPLMLNDDEAVAVVLGLIGARGPALEREAEPVDGALAKILRVLPAPLRTPGRGARADARLHGGAAPRRARRRRRRAAAGRRDPPPPARAHAPTARSRASAAGASSARTGLVVHAGRWYLAAHDHGRDDLRTFRVDRMTRRGRAPQAALAPPDGFDAVGAREPLARARAVDVGGRGAARPPGRRGRRRASRPRSPSSRRPATRRCCACASNSLDWMAGVLAGLGCDFTIRARTSCARASGRSPQRLAACA